MGSGMHLVLEMVVLLEMERRVIARVLMEREIHQHKTMMRMIALCCAPTCSAGFLQRQPLSSPCTERTSSPPPDNMRISVLLQWPFSVSTTYVRCDPVANKILHGDVLESHNLGYGLTLRL